MDPRLFQTGQPVLGICYGQQLMAHLLGGSVQKGDKGEFGLATLELDGVDTALFHGLSGPQQIWMSHRDLVAAVPAGFSVLARTDTCAVAAIAEPARGLYGVQFHPEVVHTTHGREILSNFVFGICGCAAIGIRGIAFRRSKTRFASGWAIATSSSSSAAAWIPPSPTRSACARSDRDACAASTSIPA